MTARVHLFVQHTDDLDHTFLGDDGSTQTNRVDKRGRVQQHETAMATQARGKGRGVSESIRRIAVVVPGMLGSSLIDSRGRILWGENMLDNYRRILSDPSYLKWSASSKPASGEVITQFRFMVFETDVWTRLYKKILWKDFSPGDRIEFGYDWRDDILHSAQFLVDAVAGQLGVDKSELRSRRPAEQPTLVFFTHSLGSHVVRVALGSRELHPSWIDRLIHVAPALRGMPRMFRALYDETTLPLLETLFRLRYLPNGREFHRVLLAAVRTFPSSFQVLPPPQLGYIRTRRSQLFNPLDRRCMPAAMRQHASAAHQLLEAASSIIKENVLAYSVYTDPHRNLGKKTEIQYAATEIGTTRDCRYQIDDILSRTTSGDGLVPASSASPVETRSTKVRNADHNVMCDHPKVVEAVKQYL